ncbi:MULTISPECIES: membrane protein insertase YidC [unclassified Uliginosibacterium]|uniref:membrane protein insertase YidC n=1 Tax=unclassified Uliginosibacterium TaxID=2621521 RepID=UPI000C7A378C|nr:MULTISPECIES: membrane protein insertase YidC [unclassified Uliginosibacterium]MDO6386611.1 membrane protein insertase YidC [Uliginosibacterium sp. 31-12]PLK50936.1 membrane protein insertase YidC [Uliginosibacterium sp. TH139]
MDFKRLILMAIFAFSLVMLWERWQVYKNPPQVPVAAQSAAQDGSIPAPMASATAGNAPAAGAVPGATDSKIGVYASAAKAVVKTDTMIATVSAQGGDIIRVELTQHKTNEDHRSWLNLAKSIFGQGSQQEDSRKNFVVLQEEGAHFYVANTGLIGEGLPTHKTLFELKAGEYTLQDGKDEVQLRMSAPAVNGVAVTKVLTFKRGSYLIDVSYEVNNASANPLATTAYFQLARDDKATEGSGGMFGGVSAYTGPAVFTQEGKFQKIDFKKIAKDEAKYVKSAKDGWMAMVQHYFVSAYLPAEGLQRDFYTHKISEGVFGAGIKLPLTAAAGQTAKLSVPLYVGPQEQDKLKALAPGFNLVVDYGWVTVIAEPLFWVLSVIHKLVGNWGWAIIIVTLLLKAAFYPLSASSYKSMAKMKNVMPRMKALQERYKDDKMKLNQAMMELYKTEKVNPMGGCLPILVQMPVFIALYWVLLGVVEMRQAPWEFWITDLSVKDPYFVLPIIMGVTMLIQTKLNPTPPDPVQAKVMMLMPIMFTFMFLWFPSGLVLYWVLNNVLSIAQQWYITRSIENAGAKPAK